MAQSRAHSGPPGERGAKDPRAFLQLAEEHRRSGRLKEAITVCLEGLGLHPGLDAVRITLGRAYLESGQPEIARDTLEEVFHRLPEHHLAGRLLAEAQQRLGDLSAAASTCRDLLRHYPRDREIEAILEAVTHPQPAVAGDAATAGDGAAGDAAAPDDGASAPPVPRPPPGRRMSDTPPPARRADTPPVMSDPAPEYMPEDVGVRAGKAAPGVVTPPPGRSASRASGPPAVAAPATMPAEPATQAPGAAAPAAGARTVAAPGGDALQTSTLADLYLRQGLVDRAIEVYRAMLRVDPGNERARQRLAEIESGLTAPPAAARATPASGSATAKVNPAGVGAPATAAPSAPVAPQAKVAPHAKAAPQADPAEESRRQAIARLEEWLDTVRRGSAGTRRAG